MISVLRTNPESKTLQAIPRACWCGEEASYTLELVNDRVGTGRFQRCRQHARRDMETKDFKVVEAWI